MLTEVLVEAGLTLVAEAENSRKMSKLGQARQVRNGLMVAMLAMHPIRLKNFADLEIGRNFIEIKGSWWIVLSASETKEGRPDERRIDDLLQPALDRYLRKCRPVLAGADQSTAALWLSSNDGNAMTYDGVARGYHRNHPHPPSASPSARTCSAPPSLRARPSMAATIRISQALCYITPTAA